VRKRKRKRERKRKRKKGKGSPVKRADAEAGARGSKVCMSKKAHSK
jgi:hypothetical protein